MPCRLSEHLKETVLEQNRFRSSWVENDSKTKLEGMYWEEHAEYLQAKELCSIGADPVEFVSEAGDKAYIFLKLVDYGSVDPAIVADITNTLDECAALGVDIEKAVFFKIWRNDIKYPLMFSRNGFSYSQSREISRDQYKHMGGDKVFYFAYMMISDQLYPDIESTI